MYLLSLNFESICQVEDKIDLFEYVLKIDALVRQNRFNRIQRRRVLCLVKNALQNACKLILM